MKYWSKLNSQGKVRRSYARAAGSFVTAIIIMAVMIAGYMRTEELKDKCTATAEGKVISVFSSGRYHTYSYLTAKYMVDGKEYHTKGRYGKEDGYSEFNTTQPPVVIHYNPDNSKESYACDSPCPPQYIVWIMAFIIFMVGGFLFIKQGKAISNGRLPKSGSITFSGVRIKVSEEILEEQKGEDVNDHNGKGI